MKAAGICMHHKVTWPSVAMLAAAPPTQKREPQPWLPKQRPNNEVLQIQLNWKACKSITYWSGIIRSCLITFPYSGAVKLQQPSPEPCHVLIIPIIIKMTSQLFMATSPLLEIFSKSVKHLSFENEYWGEITSQAWFFFPLFALYLLQASSWLMSGKKNFEASFEPPTTVFFFFFLTHASWLIYLAHTMQKFLALLRDH